LVDGLQSRAAGQRSASAIPTLRNTMVVDSINVEHDRTHTTGAVLRATRRHSAACASTMVRHVDGIMRMKDGRWSDRGTVSSSVRS
tara:strand:+ start:218 stop:475 length:258 start_codon:yes stop_codon:yes gene_type:complete